MTNKEVLRFWRLALAMLRLGCERLKWAQALVQNPAHHVQLIAALFGRLPSVQHSTLGLNVK